MPLLPVNTESIYEYSSNADFLLLMRSITTHLTPMRDIVNAIGIIKHDRKIFVPALSIDSEDRNGNSCLQKIWCYQISEKTVVALANPATPLRYRERFIPHNSIPGAVYQDSVLQNPDEIIPDRYDNISLAADIAEMPPFLSQLQIRYHQINQCQEG
ncbi:hypothetical protein LSTR_LSTR001655 [Laodelphax striatellus]|uniref:Uncharacterized protein n=1 Tax=Laodelphax striatellus TaxID=195883 RepID=A0A482XC29_LAOST|nr:hypothetical protein LSTR_LSTR001655 [Laodelphax striatellus]